MHSFTLTRDDFSALLKRLNQNVAPPDSVLSVEFALRVLLWTALAYSFYGVFKAYDLSTVANRHLLHAAAGAVVTFALAAAVSIYKAKRTVARLLSDNGWFLAPQTMTVHAGGIEHESKLGKAQYRWEAFTKYSEDEDRFFLLVEPGQGFVLPKRVLQEPGLQELVRSKVPQ